MSRYLFGKRGQPPTDFEVALLARSQDLDDRWVAVGKRIGASALFAVLDELGGGEILSVPTREMFVRRLYLPIRDAEIRELAANHVPIAEIARTYNISPSAVSRAIDRGLRTRTGKPDRTPA